MVNHTSLTASGKGRAASLVLLFVAAAFLLRAFLPSGFMPSVSVDGSYELVICSGMGEKTIRVSADGTQEDSNPSSGEDGACAFQMVSSQKHIPVTLFLAIPFLEIIAPDFSLTPIFHADDTAQKTYAARGPPSA